ncbi:acyl-CoA synthetase [Rhodococcus sp. MSC1_016]|jgi:fatty-acyl-CoA synthase|uniref:acyl-CoA synthetase n=1 Tax=Rhodococcus sp. MSC1_016 TaxID=2909266 RepID=UPI00202E6A04|nr:acyl-CoA synthetase [Rhodococcus sp. MSC1_016]
MSLTTNGSRSKTAILRNAQLESIPLADRDLPATTYDLLTRAAEHDHDATALQLLPGGSRWDEPQTWSYGELLRRVNQSANLYATLGLNPGGTVGLMLPNTGSTYAALLGAQALGIANPVNPMLAIDHIVDIFRLTNAKILVAPGPNLDASIWRKACEVAARLPSLQAMVTVDGGLGTPTAGGNDFDRLAATQRSDRLDFDYRPKASDIAAYFHTGGTTGTPKVAPHTHASEVYVAWALNQHPVFEGETVVLSGLPLFHVNAILITTLAPLFAGRTAVSLGTLGYRDREAMADFWKIVERYRVTTFSAVPTVYASLPQVPEGVDISSLRAGIVGAAPLPTTVRSHFETTTGVPMVEGYGLTEATCANTISPMVDPREGSVGLPLPYQRIKAVRTDSAGLPIADCDPGEAGILAIEGPCVFPGYLRAGPNGATPDPTGTIADGWLLTGDLGRVDSDGFVYLTGRAKDVIIRGGHNIDPRLIEDALLAHPDVKEAAVVARPDAHSGEVPAAYVVLRKGAEPNLEALRAWAAEHASEPAAVPRFIHSVDKIPITAVGKVHKLTLVHDSIRRLVEHELQVSGLVGDVSVTDEGGRPQVTIRFATDVATDRHKDELADHLGKYAFSYRFDELP